MKDLGEIAKELSRLLGESVFLDKTNKNKGLIQFMAPFATTLYEIKKDKENNVIIEFNEYFKYIFPNTGETEEYKKVKEFLEENNYILQLKRYDMTFPKFKPGILY